MLLLDTHTWIWRLLAPDRLSADAERAVADRENSVHLSPVTVWETMVLARKGRLSLRPSPAEWVLEALRRSTVAAVPLSHAIAMRSEQLDGFRSADPVDRFLVATALEHDLTLVTADRAMLTYAPVPTVW